MPCNQPGCVAAKLGGVDVNDLPTCCSNGQQQIYRQASPSSLSPWGILDAAINDPTFANISLVLGLLRCIPALLQLQYNNATAQFMQPTGVLVRALDDLPDGSGIDGIAYSYSNTTNYFTQTLGYTPGKNFFAAPYHWFLAEQGLEQFGYFEKIKTKIVAAYNGGYTSVAGAAAGDQQKANKRPKVVLIGHSLGTAVTIAFLQKTDPEFLKQYVGGYIAVSDVFGGAIPVLGLILSGLTPTGLASYIPPNVPPSFEQEVEILAQALLSELSSYAPSLVWLAPYRIVGGGTLPSNKGAGGGDLVPVFPADQVLVEVFNSSTVPDRYTVNDLKTLLFNAYDSKAVTNPGVGPLRTQTVVYLLPCLVAQYDVWDFPHNLDTFIKPLPAKIPLYCLFGGGLPTEVSYTYRRVTSPQPLPFIYDRQFLDPLFSIPSFSNVSAIGFAPDGDNDVNIESLAVCARLVNAQGTPKSDYRGRVVQLPGVGHSDIILKTPGLTELARMLRSLGSGRGR
eukprot:jgi/Chrzof1/6212/Cz17g15210.t1_LCAT1[v5.2]